MIDASGHPPIEVVPEQPRYSRTHAASEYVGGRCFQAVHDDLVRTSPDMFN